MSEKPPLPELPKVKAEVEGKEVEGEILMTPEALAKYLAKHEEMWPDVLPDGREIITFRGMSVRRARELADKIGSRGLTIEDIAEIFSKSPEAKQRAIENLKIKGLLPKPEENE